MHFSADPWYHVKKGLFRYALIHAFFIYLTYCVLSSILKKMILLEVYMRKGKIALFLMSAALVFAMACSYTRVLQETPNSAVIAGYAATMAEAKIAAEERAAKILGKFAHTKDTDCTQELQASKSGANTYWVCTITVKKVD